MKILHIITRLSRGGSAENVLICCDRFSSGRVPLMTDYEVVLVYGGEKINFLKKNVVYKIYHLPELVRDVSVLKDIISFCKIYKIISKENPDIVHTHSSKAGILGRWATFFYNWKIQIRNYKKKVKIIHTPHGHIFYGYYDKIKTLIFVLLEKFTARITDKIVALTKGEKNESIKFGLGKKEQWVIIPSGVDYKLRIKDYKVEKLKKEFGIQNNDLIIGTVARLEPVKGVKYFIDAIKIITDYKLPIVDYCKFLIVGDGIERKFLEEKSRKLKVNNKIIFTGMVDYVVEVMSVMDIYVQPSINEGMGKTIVIASMLGLPIVATKVQGIPDVVIDKITGFLIKPKSSKEIAKAIMDLIMDENLRKKLGSEGIKWVRKVVNGYEQFSIDRMLYDLERLYETV